MEHTTEASALPTFRNFSKKLDANAEAVRAAVSLPWSNGPVEGQISRLKMLKRQMYGRANLDLLNRRFLLTAVSPKVAKNPKKRSFHTCYYDDYCFLPLYVFCGEQLLV